MGFRRQNGEELDGFTAVEGFTPDVMACPGCGKALTQLGDVVGTDDPRCAECGSPIVVAGNNPHKRHRKHRRTALQRGRARERAAMAEVLSSAAEEGGEWN